MKAPPPPVAAVYNWTGLYIGINGGGGSAHKCWDIVNDGVVIYTPPLSQGCHDATGGTVGGQIGYRWQASNWVFGLEAQGNWADFRGSNLNLLAGTIFRPGLTDETRVRAFGLFTGQIGYAWNNVLLYVKGGAAVVDDKYDTFAPGFGTIDSASETRWGGTVGAGVEVGFAPNWSVGVEYDHLFLGTRDIDAYEPGGTFSATDRIHQDVDMGLVRVNYRWGGPLFSRF